MLSADTLTDAEVEELDKFLLNEKGIEESMDISTLDGFLTAIVCGPKTILPSEWLRWVWDMERGQDSPRFKDKAEAQKILGLMMRHMNDIAGTLHQTPEQYDPLLVENPNDGDPVPIIDEWCCGFMKGVHLDSEGWLPILAGKPALLSTILLYGTEDGWDVLKMKKLSLDEHRALAHGLADTVRTVHALWLKERQPRAGSGRSPAAMRREPIRNPDKVGRNEPCPCGSGRKFKQCHGAASTLH